MNIGSERKKKKTKCKHFRLHSACPRVRLCQRTTSKTNRISLFHHWLYIQMYFVWFIAFCFIESDTWHFHFIAQPYKIDWIVASSFATKFEQHNGKMGWAKTATIARKKIFWRIFHIYMVCAVFHFIRQARKDKPITDSTIYHGIRVLPLLPCVMIKGNVVTRLLTSNTNVLSTLLRLSNSIYSICVFDKIYTSKSCSVEKNWHNFVFYQLYGPQAVFFSSNRFSVAEKATREKQQQRHYYEVSTAANAKKTTNDDMYWKRFICQVCSCDECMYDGIITWQRHQWESTHDSIGEIAPEIIRLNEWRQTRKRK